jgi:hypothetical protein
MSAERSATPTTAKPMIPVAKLVARGSAMSTCALAASSMVVMAGG